MLLFQNPKETLLRLGSKQFQRKSSIPSGAVPVLFLIFRIPVFDPLQLQSARDHLAFVRWRCFHDMMYFETAADGIIDWMIFLIISYFALRFQYFG